MVVARTPLIPATATTAAPTSSHGRGPFHASGGSRVLEPDRVARADAVAGVEQKANDLLAQVDAHRELSSSLSHDAT
jgi:hypothetical protein